MTDLTMSDGRPPGDVLGWQSRLQTEQALQAQSILTLKGEVQTVGAQVKGLETSVTSAISALENTINARGKTPWPILIAAGTLLFGMTGGLVAVLNSFLQLNMQGQLAPIAGQLMRVTENQKLHDEDIKRIQEAADVAHRDTLASSLADVQSRTDRGQLNDRLHVVEQRQSENLADRKAETAALSERAVEVETQFRAEDRIRNMLSAEQQRWNSIIWSRLFPGVPYPSITYFPEMARSDPLVGK